jgi:hypothetical protein
MDRWRRWFNISLGVHLSTILCYPALIRGCHCHMIAVPVGLVPVVWGGYTLVTHQAVGERVLGYINGALAFGWLYLAWDSNLQCALR